MSDKTKCLACGYTKEDAVFNMDHHLCKNAGKAPWEVAPQRIDPFYGNTVCGRCNKRLVAGNTIVEPGRSVLICADHVATPEPQEVAPQPNSTAPERPKLVETFGGNWYTPRDADAYMNAREAELAQLRAEIEAAWALFANAGVMKFDDAGHERLWNTQAEKWAKRNRRPAPPSERDTPHDPLLCVHGVFSRDGDGCELCDPSASERDTPTKEKP